MFSICGVLHGQRNISSVSFVKPLSSALSPNSILFIVLLPPCNKVVFIVLLPPCNRVVFVVKSFYL